MDVAKYIGLFLMKNHNCFIQGLGNLELKSMPAYYDGQNLHAPSYEVILTNAGSIDESLANFIATSELISISKALNALRDFSLQSKADLQVGKDVTIPFIGRFIETDGKVGFITDSKLQYTPGPMPSVRMTRRIEENPVPKYQPQEEPLPNNRRQRRQEYTPPPPPPPPKPAYIPQDLQEEDDDDERSINWGRVIFVLSLLFVLGLGAVYLFEIYKERKNITPPVLQQQPVTMPDTQKQAPPVQLLPDTTKRTDSTSHDSAITVIGPDILENAPATKQPAISTPAKPQLATYDVVINNYYTAERAQKRMQQLKSYGYTVRMGVEDSTNYLIIMSVKFDPRDKDKALDSLATLFNPSDGVYIH